MENQIAFLKRMESEALRAGDRLQAKGFRMRREMLGSPEPLELRELPEPGSYGAGHAGSDVPADGHIDWRAAQWCPSCRSDIEEHDSQCLTCGEMLTMYRRYVVLRPKQVMP